MSWCVLVEYVKDNYYARFHNPSHYRFRDHTLIFLCDQLTQVAHLSLSLAIVWLSDLARIPGAIKHITDESA